MELKKKEENKKEKEQKKSNNRFNVKYEEESYLVMKGE